MAEHIVINSVFGSTEGLLNYVGSEYVVLLIHGFGSNKETKQFDEIEKMLNVLNISTFRVDQYGHGVNKANFKNLTVTKAIALVIDAIYYLDKRGFKNICLLGSSFGGLTGFFATLSCPRVSLLILKSPASEMQGDLILKFKNIDLEKWKKDKFTKWVDRSGENILGYDFYEDANKYSIFRDIDKLNVPVLIIHGGKDSVVPVQQSINLQKNRNAVVNIIDSAEHKYNEDETKTMIKHISEFIRINWF